MRLFLSTQWRIYGFIAALVPTPADADDIFQETALVLWRRFATFKPGTNFVAWALQVARNKVLTYWDQRKTARRFAPEGLELFIDELAKIAENSDMRFEALEHCLDKLPAKSREIIRLRYSLGASTQSVAERLERTPSAVYKALNRIHEALRDCLTQTLKQSSRAGEA